MQMGHLRLSTNYPTTVALRLATFYLLAWGAYAADAGSFSYYGSKDSGPKPDQWGNNPDWRLCKEGKEQSPINISTRNSTFETNFLKLENDYNPVNGILFIDSANILEVELLGEGGTFKIGEKTYQLLQFHFHSPSEHTIDGYRFPLEMHLVHKSESGDLAVIGIPFSIGPKNSFLAEFWDELPRLTDRKVTVNLTNVDVNEPNLRFGPAHARYPGSLTTPPCSEQVTWTVILGKSNTVSKEQMWTYSKLLPNSNARPVQGLNDRKVGKNLGLFRRK